MNSSLIPIVLTFDENYILPAGVAMHSLMQCANPNYIYEFNIIHHGISEVQQYLLIENLKFFQNQNVKFIYCNQSFENIFNQLKNPSHFSQEMFYKLILPSLLPQYDKVIVSDVDVIFKGDISSVYHEFNGKEYLAVVKHYSKTLQDCLKITYSTFDEDYVQKINNFGVGFCLLNLKAMREDNIENKLLDFIEKNIDKLRYPEQEAFNYICHENVKYINIKYMMVPMWIRPDISNNEINQKYYSFYSGKDVLNAFFHPVQIHYASWLKPWNSFQCDHFADWIEALSRTIFLQEYLSNLQNIQQKKLYKSIKNYNKNRINYFRYRLFAKLCSGKKQERYLNKSLELEHEIQLVKSLKD